jgi:hypothetical protein
VGQSFEAGKQIMSDDSAKSRLNVELGDDLTRQLNDGRLSRRGLRERLTGLGIGFGAAFVLGMTGAQATQAPEAAPAPDTTVALKSTNAAINAIIDNNGQVDQKVTTPVQQLAYYNRWFRRWYNRYYHRW